MEVGVRDKARKEVMELHIMKNNQMGLIFLAVSFFFCLHISMLLLPPVFFRVYIDSYSFRLFVTFWVSEFSSAIMI